MSTIVARMEQAQEQNRTQFHAYTATREYRLYGGSEQGPPRSQVIAEINFIPPDQKTFTLEHVAGNEHGTKIVKDLLKGEAEAAKKDNDAVAIDHDNYNFKLLGQDTLDGHDCWLLELDPKREDKHLIQGRAWVDKQSYMVRKVDGNLAKNPSWWLKNVHATVTFNGVNGMWMQTDTRAVADVRLFGTHIFVGNLLKVRNDDYTATVTRPPVRKRRAAPTSLLGTGIMRH